MRTVGAVLVALVMLAGSVTTVHADGAQGAWLQDWQVRIAAGGSRRIQYYALHGDAGFRFWGSADEWLTNHRVTGRWLIEPWVGFLNDEHNPHPNNGVEIGVNALFGRLTFGATRLRPFLEGGEGALYTTRRKSTLGDQGFFFASQIGGGLEYDIRPGLSFTFAVRYRHISTAGFTSSNAGLNTMIGLIGLTFR
jgi:hypothetical protein